jgi:hypothetical protein
VRAGNPVVVAAVVVGGLLLAAGMAFAQGGEPGELEIYDAIPAETTLHLRVGARRQFSIWVRGENLNYQWQIDGGPVGDRHAWAFTPRLTDIGFHLVTVVVDGPAGRVTRTWRVQVEVPAPGEPEPTMPAPSIAPPPVAPPSTVAPATSPTTERPTSSTSTSSTTSTHEPTTSSTRVPTTTTTRRPTTTEAPTTTTTRRPTTTEAPTTTTARPTTSSSVTSTTAPPRVPTTLARPGAITENEVRALFERYKAAWRNHDINALESVGQVATQGQADALKSYFESVEDLEVDVTILSIVIGADEARVKFIRRDRFRDPGGSMVTKESPVIEKRIVRTPGGLRLAPLR